MAVRKDYKTLVKKLTKQVRLLERKEEKARRQLGAAVKKIRKLGRTYKTKLASKLRTIKTKVAAAKTSAYEKVAANLERKMLKNIQAKGKALAAAIAKIEKKHVSKLTKSVVKKGKTNKSKVKQRTKLSTIKTRSKKTK
jgi:hypothetical protein